MVRFKTFKHFLDLPSEIRMIMIDEMNSADRCRITRCSRFVSQEVKRSRKSLEVLALRGKSANDMQLIVAYSVDDKLPSGYLMNFKTDTYTGKKCIKYFKLNLGRTPTKELWKTDLEDSTDMIELIDQYFNEKLHIHHDAIHYLAVLRTFPKLPFTLDVQSLKNVVFLELHEPCNAPEFLSKTRKPLDTLYMGQEIDLAGCEEIYRVYNRLYSQHTKLNVEQLRRLSCQDAQIHIGELTEQNIYDFIKSWENGRKVTSFEWNLTGSNFNIDALRSLFPEAIIIGDSLFIRNSAGQYGKLQFSEEVLKFSVQQTMDEQ